MHQPNNRRSRNGSGAGRTRASSSQHPKSHSRRPRRAPAKQNRSAKRKLPTFDPSQFINTNPVNEIEPEYTPQHTFGDFGLDKRLTRQISARNLHIPSPIQDKIIPEILSGNDVVGIAETGTGKTAAFLIPLINKTLHQYQRQTLIVTPTRELAIQIEQEFKTLAKQFKLYATVCVGGANMRAQINQLRRTNHFIIGTPGRLLDLAERGNLDLSKVSTVVLDEADRMLDMGFIHPIRSILEQTPRERENMFFSATMDDRTEGLVREFCKDPTIVSVKKKDVTNSIKQDVVRYANEDKFTTLTTMLSDEQYRRVIIFGAMKHGVEKLAKQLNRDGIGAESIHGNKTHAQRQRSLRNFKSGQARVLVATDVAARGIHVDNVSHVINYDLPNTFSDYVHRIGRTGRGDKRGEALTFVPSHVAK